MKLTFWLNLFLASVLLIILAKFLVEMSFGSFEILYYRIVNGVYLDSNYKHKINESYMIVGRDPKGVTVKSEFDIIYSVRFVSRDFFDDIYSRREFAISPKGDGCAMITGKGLSGYFYMKENPLIIITVHDEELPRINPCNILDAE